MTVSTTTGRATPYTGNGVTTSFPVTFEFNDDSDIKVYVDDTLKTLTTHYTVTGGDGETGTVTFSTAPVTGASVVIFDDPPMTQEVDYTANDPFPAETHEGALDKLTRLVRRVSSQVDRSVHLPDSNSTVTSTELPEPTALNVIGWNAAADELVNYDPSAIIGDIATVSWRADTFDGDGTTTAFSLTLAPGSSANCDVTISGVSQRPDVDFVVSGVTLTFTTAPPIGTANICARYGSSLAVATADSLDVSYLSAGGYVKTVQAKLRAISFSVEDYGAVGDGDGAGGGTDDSAAFQAALNALEASGGTLTANGEKTYRIDTAITLLRDSSGDAVNLILDFNGAKLDCSNNTSNAAVSIGATSASYFSDSGNIVLRNCTIIGPETLYPGDTANAPVNGNTGLDLIYAGNISLENVRVNRFYCGIKSEFVFPLLASNVFVSSCWVGVDLRDASNVQTWNGLNVTSARYAIVIRANIGAGFGVNSVTFITPRIESCVVGIVLDPGTTSTNEIRGVSIINPFIAQMSRDLVRVGIGYTFETPSVRGSDQAGKVYGLHMYGGHWSYTHDASLLKPLVASTSGTVIGANIAVPFSDEHFTGLLANSVLATHYNYTHANTTKTTFFGTSESKYVRIENGTAPKILVNASSTNGLMRLKDDKSGVTFAEVGNESVDASSAVQLRAQADTAYGYLQAKSSAAATPNQVALGNSSNGTVKIETTGAFLVNADAPLQGTEQCHVSAVGSVAQTWKSNTATAGSAALQVYSNVTATNTKHFEMQADGDLFNTNNSYGAISDERLKRDIQLASSQWEDVKRIDVCRFSFRNDPSQTRQIGVIAQQVARVSPGLVKEDSDGMLSVKYSVLNVKALAALQEAMRRIEQLERLINLKA